MSQIKKNSALILILTSIWDRIMLHENLRKALFKLLKTDIYLCFVISNQVGRKRNFFANCYGKGYRMKIVQKIV